MYLFQFEMNINRKVSINMQGIQCWMPVMLTLSKGAFLTENSTLKSLIVVELFVTQLACYPDN